MTTSIVLSDDLFSNCAVDFGDTQSYRGGASIDPGGDVWLSRQEDGIWPIERWTRSGED